MSTPLSRVVGPALPLPLANIDTDTIIRIEHLLNPTPERLGQFAFWSLHHDADGRADPASPFNRDPWRGAPIIVAGRNFGCGSSREHAVWAMQARGFRCVIAESFGDIFVNNCCQNGLLPVRLPAAAVEQLLDAATAGRIFRVDLERKQVVVDDGPGIAFEFNEWQRQRLLTGRDEVLQTLTLTPAIAEWQDRDRQGRPWLWHARDVHGALSPDHDIA